MIAMGFVVGAVFYQLDDRMFTILGSFITDRWSELPDIDTDAVEPLTLGFGCYTEVAFWGFVLYTTTLIHELP